MTVLGSASVARPFPQENLRVERSVGVDAEPSTGRGADGTPWPRELMHTDLCAWRFGGDCDCGLDNDAELSTGVRSLSRELGLAVGRAHRAWAEKRAPWLLEEWANG